MCWFKQRAYTGFNILMIDKYIKKILEASVTAVVYSQVNHPDNTITRSLTGIFLQEHILIMIHIVLQIIQRVFGWI